MSNAINWFELPATNFERAVKFYSELIGEELQPFQSEEVQMAFFPAPDQGVGGCVTFGNGNQPRPDGALVYLNGGHDLQEQLSRVEPAGGKVLLPKTNIGENGYMAYFLDTEGNRVALHSMH